MKKAVLLALLLGGCDLTASQERQTDANICAGYGFKVGTPEFANCQMTRDQQRQAGHRAAIEQISRNNQAATDQQAQQLQQNYQQYRQNNSRQPTNCTTVPTGGGGSSTTCY